MSTRNISWGVKAASA